MDIKKIKKLREETNVSISDVKRALEESKGDCNKAKKLLSLWGVKKASEKVSRETNEGLVEAYIHANGKIGSLVSIACETDFVARTGEFKTLAKEIAMQVAAMNPKSTKELLKQDYIRNQKITIDGLIKQSITKLGENITIKAFSRQAF